MSNDFDSLFEQHTEIKFEYQKRQCVVTYRAAGSEEWLEFQRRISNFKINKKFVSATDDSVGARLWLHEKLRVKCEVIVDDGGPETGDGRSAVGAQLIAPVRIEVEDKFPSNVKDQVLLAFLGQMQLDEGN